MDLESVLPVVLIVAMLAITASRAWAPFPVKLDGETVLEVKVGLLFRALRQRANVLAILAVLVLGTGTFGATWISPAMFTFTLIALFGLLLLPIRYRFTTKGVSPDPSTFRPWSDFTSWIAGGNVFELKGTGRLSALRLYVANKDREAVSRVLTRFLGARG